MRRQPPGSEPAAAAAQPQPHARLSEVLGAEVFHASGIGHSSETGQLQARIAELEQHLLDLRRELEERTDELDAARAANQDLTALATSKPASPP